MGGIKSGNRRGKHVSVCVGLPTGLPVSTLRPSFPSSFDMSTKRPTDDKKNETSSAGASGYV